ncbi:Villin headpiece [Macleaya cordata]|uniref:Villin headpiece n=1 Tax=Macleaya cordata TaxID=56857 RepID=A0A200PWS6_MACCD|nr:Villin headpiece [Macleaya cordata]
MSLLSKVMDAAFQGAGVKAGLEIWCIENFQLVPVPKSSYGKFFSGSAYVILNTVLLKSGVLQHDIHYWLGNDAKEVDSVIASDKALEFDATLGSHAVQYREVQGHETEKFLSYFKPCIIPIAGVFSSESGDPGSESYRVSLLTCKGDRAVYVKEVPFSRSSLNHNDVFILDTASKVFLFSGCNSSIQERAKALEVAQYIIENKHNGRCEVATIEDGKFVGDADVGEFWSLFGGYAPITRDVSCTVQKPEIPSRKLFWINPQGKLSQVGTDPLKKEMLSSDKCYMLDCETKNFVWMGRRTSITERKSSISALEVILNSQDRSTGNHIIFLTEGSETAIFKSYFDGWPQTVGLNLYEEGRGKVAAMFKQQGYDVKELPEDDSEPFIDCTGTLKVWRVNENEVSLVPVVEQAKLFSGDCYIVQYTYPGDGKDEDLFYAWLGHNSIMVIPFSENYLLFSTNQISELVSLLKHNSCCYAQIIEGKEPAQFYLIFQTLIVLKGGTSSRYKKFISEKGIADETYAKDKIALFRVQGSGPNNMQAIQVDLISGSLNSSYCYILQTGASIFTWTGNLSSPRDHDLLDRMLLLISPTWQPISVREGSEPDVFWNALGGKAEYPREKEIKCYVEDPNLFMCTSIEGERKTSFIIFNFTQDDLTTEDALVLDCHNEIYVWMGHHANIRSKQQALTLGMKFLETDILVEGLSLETPIYLVTEGHEPSFFTRFFEWDSSKAQMHGNSFEKKLAILKGQTQKLETPKRSSWKASDLSSTGATTDRSRRKSIISNGLGRSVSPASHVLGSNFEGSNSRRFSSPSPIVRKLFRSSSPDRGIAGNEASPDSHRNEIKDGSLVSQLVEPISNSGTPSPFQVDESEVDDVLETFPYERLKVMSDDPVTGIDVTKREAYLSHEEFQEKFGMTKKAFYELPKWRQNKHKAALHLF